MQKKIFFLCIFPFFIILLLYLSNARWLYKIKMIFLSSLNELQRHASHLSLSSSQRFAFARLNTKNICSAKPVCQHFNCFQFSLYVHNNNIVKSGGKIDAIRNSFSLWYCAFHNETQTEPNGRMWRWDVGDLSSQFHSFRLKLKKSLFSVLLALTESLVWWSVQETTDDWMWSATKKRDLVVRCFLLDCLSVSNWGIQMIVSLLQNEGSAMCRTAGRRHKWLKCIIL